jgi:hypothetical protein
VADKGDDWIVGMRRAVARESVLFLWVLALTAVVLGPALGPGYVLAYDMVWVPDLAMRSDFLGLATGLPRAVPSDAVVAALDELVPGMLLQKLVLVGPLVAGGLGASRLVPDRLVARSVAATAYVWNALVAERLLIGHWPILVAYAAAPWVLLAAREWRERGRFPARLLWLVPLGSLSAGAGLATAVFLLASAGGRARLGRLVLLLLAANAPWLVAGLLHSGTAVTDADGATVFATHAEGPVPAVLAALTLGGIWNAEVVPDSRAGSLGWVSLVLLVALALAGLRPWLRRTRARDRLALLVCWGVGFGAAVVSWAAPEVLGWVATRVPGGGLLRDGSRLLVLCAPLFVTLVAEGALEVWRRVPSGRVPRTATALGLVLLPVALLPDAAWGVGGGLRAVAFPAAYGEARSLVADHGEGDVLVLPATSYRQPVWNHDQKVLDPLGRYLTLNFVASDVLVVSGTTLSGEDPRFAAAVEALAGPSAEGRSLALAALGVGVVVVDGTAPGPAPDLAGSTLLASDDLTVVVLPGPDRRAPPAGWIIAMTMAWAAFLAVPAGAGLILLRRRRGRDTPRVAGEWCTIPPLG